VEGSAAPAVGSGIADEPGLLFGVSGIGAAGAPGIDEYADSAANSGADGSAAPGEGSGAEGIAAKNAFAMRAISDGSRAPAASATACSCAASSGGTIGFGGGVASGLFMVSVCVVVIFADVDIIEHAERIFRQHGKRAIE